VRDLVIDLDGFMEKLKAVKPWIIVAKERAVRGGAPTASRQRSSSTSSRFSMCINCMLC